MTRARSDGRIFLGLGILAFIFLGLFFRYSASDSMVDFKMLYYGARALLQHSDPYKQKSFSTLIRAESGESKFIDSHPSMAASINLPTTYFLSAPLAMVPFALASAIWSLFTAATLTFAACLIWCVGAKYAPILSGALAGLALVNGAVVVGNGNSAGVIVGLCIVAVWCLIGERLVWFGVCCLAISLVVKPQDAGLLWLCFLLGRGLARKRAFQTIAIAVMLSLPAVIWVSRSAPQWIPELHWNLVDIAAQGANCDPGPTGLTAKTGTMEVITDLQTVVSVFRDSPSFYNSITFLFCGLLLAVWAIAVLRSNSSPTLLWLALAVIVPLSLLVTYHRAYDARLLLLCVPACAMLWARHGRIAKLALAFTVAGFVFTGEIPLAFINALTRPLHLSAATLPGKLATVALARPATLSLLAMTLFYLWVLVRVQRSEATSVPAVAVDERAVSAENP